MAELGSYMVCLESTRLGSPLHQLPESVAAPIACEFWHNYGCPWAQASGKPLGTSLWGGAPGSLREASGSGRPPGASGKLPGPSGSRWLREASAASLQGLLSTNFRDANYEVPIATDLLSLSPVAARIGLP